MTLDTTKVATLVAPAEEEDVDVLESPYDIAVKKIVEEAFDETGCTEADAKAAITWLNRYVEAARVDDYAWQFPCTDDMQGIEYKILDVVMQHGAVATAGSAHEALQNALLDPSKGELTLLHDDRDEEGTPTYCSFQVAIGVFGV